MDIPQIEVVHRGENWKIFLFFTKQTKNTFYQAMDPWMFHVRKMSPINFKFI
jgi:hypothetical protein